MRRSLELVGRQKRIAQQHNVKQTNNKNSQVHWHANSIFRECVSFLCFFFFSLYFRLISWSKRYNIETLVAIVCMYTLYYYTCNVVHKQCISYGFSGEIKNFIDYNTHEMCVCVHIKLELPPNTRTEYIYIYICRLSLVFQLLNSMEVVAKRRKNDGSGSLHYLTSDIHANAQSDWPIQAQIPPAEWEISDCTERSLHIITHCYPMVFLSLFLYIIHLCAMCMLVGFRRWPHRIFCNIYIYTTLIRWCVAKWTKPPKIKTDENNTTLLYYMKMKIINKAEKKEKLWLNHNIKWIQHRGRRQKLHHHHRITSKAWARAHTAPQSLSTPWPKKKIININTEV